MSKRTQTDMIRETLADRIVHGFLRPGEPMDETSIAAEFGVSRTPVREALRQLEANGLALSRPHRGAVVTKLTERELDDTFVVMAELEALCARLCATTMAGAELDAFALLHHEGAAHAADNDIEAYRAHNERFHNAIYAGSHNPFLERTTLSVRRRLAPFRNLQFEAFHRPDASHREHGLIVSAIIAGDGEEAAATMRRHILTVRKAVDTVQPHTEG
ncbi:GntR family transcriptional regulator [Jiella sp. M17.18]|uniref:GntR family transcriptional regulator n=1 Tax=Jiella sp. M17.18 TaxID=3234247 RepID=UPI0034DEAC31